MVDLRRTPSVQHAVALISDSVAETRRNLELLDAAQISISLNPARRLIKPLMEGFDVEWAKRMCAAERYEKNRKPNADLVEAFAPYAKDKAVGWFRPCEPDFYPIGGGVHIPIHPSGYWAEGGKLHLLWVQCWKSRTLNPRQKAIFNTIFRQRVLVGDFKDAILEWVDLREVHAGKGRDIEVLNGEALGTVSEADLAGYLDVLLTAFREYRMEKDRRRAEEKAEAKRRPQDSGPLFEGPDGTK
jgi:hypothetical protein